jgi:shikimate dehydrogenase
LLARRWSDAGGKTLSGYELLLYQGTDQLNLVTGLDVKSFDRQLRIALTNATN